ncbi:MAG TPA: HAD family phosphatase [Caldithrix abyssi]|uniref:HAD family phosphatase n=1 Tax=Caldithrix abyssi TaxID=187145 RepID=A0A7V4WVB7_CALAY|nr:HAD family phosphatase [Caldithrix abyssi]
MIKIEKNIQALIFDCDGTLVDSMPLHFEAWRETFKKFGRSYPHDFVNARKGMRVADVVREYNRHYNDHLNVLRFTAIKEEIALKRLQTVKPIEPVAEVVRHHAGILPMAVCSGSPEKSVRISLQAVGLAGLFKVILTADDGLAPKPAPDMFLEAARCLNVVPERCQVFEDGDYGIEAAEKAGMIVTDIRKYI